MEGSGSRLATAGEDLKIWASPSFSLVHQVSFPDAGLFLIHSMFSVYTLFIVVRLFKLLEPGHNMCGKCAQGERADLAHLLQEGFTLNIKTLQ